MRKPARKIGEENRSGAGRDASFPATGLVYLESTMKRLLLALPLLATACAAPGPTLSQRLSPLVGQSEGQLVSTLGVPVRTYEADGRKFLEFQSQRLTALPGDPFWGGGFGYGGRPFGWGGVWGPPTTVWAPVTCNVTFALRADRVEDFTYRGEGCA